MASYIEALWDVIPDNPLSIELSEATLPGIANDFYKAADRANPRTNSVESMFRELVGAETTTKEGDKLTSEDQDKRIVELIEGIYHYGAISPAKLYEAGYGFAAEDRRSEALRAMLAFFDPYQQFESNKKSELMIVFCRGILHQTFSTVVPLNSAGALAAYEAILHLFRSVLMKTTAKPYNEHLRHACLVFYIGLHILKRFRPAKHGSLATKQLVVVVQKMVEEYVCNNSEMRAVIASHTTSTRFDEVAAIIKSEMFVVSAWAMVSLMHDIGYYMAAFLDLFRFNSTTEDGTQIDVLASVARILHEPNYSQMKEMTAIISAITATHIPADHFDDTIAAIRMVVQKPTKLRATFYNKHRGQFHCFWTCWELWERFVTIGLSGDVLREKLALLLAIRAIYPYHFVGECEAKEIVKEIDEMLKTEPDDLGRLRELIMSEPNANLSFKQDPLGFLLILCDNIQTFSRFEFRAVTPTAAGGVAIDFTKRDLMCVLTEEDSQYEDCCQLKVSLGGAAADYIPTHMSVNTFRYWLAKSNAISIAHSKSDGSPIFLVECETDRSNLRPPPSP
jgi:hypothetical protein